MSNKLNVGDVVHVRGVVTERPLSDDPYVSVNFPFAGSGTTCHVRATDIVHVEPRALQVGDKVKRKTIGGITLDDDPAQPVGELLAVIGQWTMVQWGTHPVTVPLADLVRA